MGPDDFVLGYSAIYSFAHRANGEPYTNANPVTDGLHFGPDEVKDDPESCSDGTCLDQCKPETGCVIPDVDCEAHPTLCMPACPDDGDPTKCPPHNLRLDIDRTTFEKDDVANDAYGNDYGEQMWIDYYSTRGNFHSSTKLLNDATTGYNSANGTQFYAPSERGKVSLWIVTHDNRGGMSWRGTTLLIQ